MDWKGNSSKIPLNVYVSLAVVECVCYCVPSCSGVCATVSLVVV